MCAAGRSVIDGNRALVALLEGRDLRVVGAVTEAAVVVGSNASRLLRKSGNGGSERCAGGSTIGVRDCCCCCVTIGSAVSGLFGSGKLVGTMIGVACGGLVAATTTALGSPTDVMLVDPPLVGPGIEKSGGDGVACSKDEVVGLVTCCK